jgi:predicted metal-dependent hydrolase
MDDALRAGVALFNTGEYHAAHEPWEDRWLEAEAGTPDERLLHGLIQYTAVVYHARRRNWSGTVGLADRAGEYLETLPPRFRGIDVGSVRRELAALRADPERIERRSPPSLRYEGRPLDADGLDFEPAALAAAALAEEYERYDTERIRRAIEYAREELDGPGRTRFIALVMDFVADAARRDLVYQRLSEHLDRRVHREHDVSGLFD